MELLQILLALVVLSVLVVVHELGHFLAAKKIGVWAEEFGVGLPPRVWGRKIGETIYSINALPIGGFVRLHGEVGEDGEKVKYPDRAFINKKALPRIFVAVAGVVMNILFAVLCFSLIYAFTGVPQEMENGVVITSVSENSPAAEARIFTDTIVTHFNDEPVTFENFASLIDQNKGNTVRLMLEDGSTKEVFIREEAPEGEGLMGIAFTNQELVQPVWYSRPFVYLQNGVEDTWFWMQQTVIGFGTLFSDISSGRPPEGVLGPVGITLTIAEFLKSGIVSILGLAGIISINLALINILPFPPLDGSRVMFIVGEELFGKDFIRKHEAKLHLVGMGVLLLLIVAMTFKEIPALINAGSISGFVESMLQ